MIKQNTEVQNELTRPFFYSAPKSKDTAPCALRGSYEFLAQRISPAGIPSWSDQPQELDSLIGKTIRLRFFLRQAEIYSFQSVMPE